MIKVNLATGKTTTEESFEYDDPLALAAVDGTSGAGGPEYIPNPKGGRPPRENHVGMCMVVNGAQRIEIKNRVTFLTLIRGGFNENIQYDKN
jgi:hypothetical protein